MTKMSALKHLFDPGLLSAVDNYYVQCCRP